MSEKMKVWSWPDGLLFRGVIRAGARMRRGRYGTMWRMLCPNHGDTVLEVGVTSREGGARNHLLEWYPWPENVIACGLEQEPPVCGRRGIRFVYADGCDLPFADGQFDIVHCNAVLEHVGSRNRQGRFVRELCRVGKKLFLSTPDKDSPLEVHTLLPFVHWLPRGPRGAIYKLAGRGYFADEENLNLLDSGSLRGLFPGDLRSGVRICRQYFVGLPAVITAVLGSRAVSGRRS